MRLRGLPMTAPWIHFDELVDSLPGFLNQANGFGSNSFRRAQSCPLKPSDHALDVAILLECKNCSAARLAKVHIPRVCQ
jgi:hypothetical protein